MWKDPYKILPAVVIVVGLLIVVAGAVFWAVTGRQSQLILSAGLVLTFGSGAGAKLTEIYKAIPHYDDPPNPDKQTKDEG